MGKQYIIIKLEDLVGANQNSSYHIQDFVKKLKETGYKLALVSMQKEEVLKQQAVDLDISQYFDVLIGEKQEGEECQEEIWMAALNKLFHYKQIKSQRVILLEQSIDKTVQIYDYQIERRNLAESTLLDGSLQEDCVKDFLPFQELAQSQGKQERNLVQEKKERILGNKNIQYFEGESTGVPSSGSAKLWALAIPFLLFFLYNLLAQQLIASALFYLGEHNEGLREAFFVSADFTTGQASWTSLGDSIIRISSFVVVIIAVSIQCRGKFALKEIMKFSWKQHGKVLVTYLGIAVGTALTINIVFAAVGLLGDPNYQEVADRLYYISLPLGLLLYGIIAPLAEELVFRGILYRRNVRYMEDKNAILISSLLFALYHQNQIQGIYAFVLGYILAKAYSKSGNFLVPLVLHGVVNIIVFLLSEFGFFTLF